jgi:thioredoxin-related protein
MKYTLYFYLLSLILAGCKNSPEEIVWLNVKDANNEKNEEKKHYFVDVYTEWCGWCKVMDRETFSQKEVIDFMNKNFHNIKFDAEQRETVVFNNKTYMWVNSGRNGINMLAMDLLNTELSYPSYVILDENKKPVEVLKGYMEVSPFLASLKKYEKQ